MFTSTSTSTSISTSINANTTKATNNLHYAIVITDGASGEPLPQFNGKTSLEQAHTPHLDALAQAGTVGLAVNVPKGLEPSSNVACTSICGYDPLLYPIGRGALECAALGVSLGPDEVALRLNLTHVSPEGIMVSYSTNNISAEDGGALLAELAAALNDDTFTLHKGTGFRGYLVVKGHPGLMNTQLAAAHNITDEPVAAHLPQGPEAALIQDYAQRAKAVLAASPLNARRSVEGLLAATDVFVFWPGQRPAGMVSFMQTYGKRAGMMSGVDLLNGIARLADINTYHFEGVTDGPNNNYAAQGKGALAMLEHEEVVFIHVEAPDAEGHDGNPEGKVAALEAIDREIIARLMQYAKGHPLRLLVLPDHPTPALFKRHTSDPVPFVMAGPGIASNSGSRLTEAEGAATGLVIDPGYMLLTRFLAS